MTQFGIKVLKPPLFVTTIKAGSSIQSPFLHTLEVKEALLIILYIIAKSGPR